MNVVYLLVPLSIFLAFIGLLAFLWALKGGQFDDTDTPAHRILTDDE